MWRFPHCWWECKPAQPLWRTVWRFFRKLGIELSYNSAIPLPGIYPEKTITERDPCTPMIIAALFKIVSCCYISWNYHNLFNQTQNSEHLGYFHTLPTANNSVRHVCRLIYSLQATYKYNI